MPVARNVSNPYSPGNLEPHQTSAFSKVTYDAGLAKAVPTPPFVVLSSDNKKKKSKRSSSKKSGGVNLHKHLRKSEWKPLLEAVRQLEQNLEETDSSGQIHQALIFRDDEQHESTPLHTAAWKAPPRLTLFLLSLVPLETRKQYLLARDADGNTPLHLACANLDERVEFSVVKNLLLLAPEALEMKNAYGDTPLHLLVSSDGFAKNADNFSVEAAAEEAIVSLLSMVGPEAALVTNGTGLTLLHVAIARGAHERVLVQLLEHAPEQAQSPDHVGMIPLHYAAAFMGAPWTLCEQLVEAYPAGITAQTHNGDTPLHLLMSNAHKHVLDETTQRVDRSTIKLAELLIGKTANQHKSPLLRNSPLFMANREHLTPLHCCALFETPPPLVQLVMDHAGEACTVTTPLGATALHLACASPTVRLETVEALAVPDACDVMDACAVMDRHGRTPLAVAVDNEKAGSKVIKALCKAHKYAARQPTMQGYLPLHLAMQRSKVKESIVKTLLKAYPKAASVVLQNNGNTALHEACANKATPYEVLELLVSYNISALHCPNYNGQTPFELVSGPMSDKALHLLQGRITVKSKR